MENSNINIPEFNSEKELIKWAVKNAGQNLLLYNITKVFPHIIFDPQTNRPTNLELLTYFDENDYAWVEEEFFIALELRLYRVCEVANEN